MMVRWLGACSTNFARSLFLGGLVIAAVDYGLTRESSIRFFNAWMAVTIVAWFIGMVLDRNRPGIPLPIKVGVVGVLLVGGISTLFAWISWRTEMRLDYPAWIDDWLIYGAVDLNLAVSAMIRTAVLLGSLLLAFDLFNHSHWTRAMFATIAATALGMTMLFVLQRTVGGSFLLSSELQPSIKLSFATFRYHGNAASYLNLCWPLLAALAVHTISRDRARGWTVWLTATLIVFSALFLNNSKAGNVLGAVGALGFLGLLGLRGLRLGHARRIRISPAVVLAVGLPTLIIGVSLVFALPTARWESFAGGDMSTEARIVAYGHFARMVPDAGWIGFGPGTFQTIYWDYVGDDPIMQKAPFWVAHQDYLQTLVEWGWLGTFFWGVLLVVPVFALFRSGWAGKVGARRNDVEFAYSWTQHIRFFWNAIPDASSPVVALGGCVAIVLTALHSLVDFPMQIESLQFYFLIWIALGWHVWQNRPGSRRPET